MLRTSTSQYTAIVFGIVVLCAAPGEGQEQSDGNALLTRVRSSNGTITAAIRDATADSATFRRLRDTIERTNGVVYVEDGICRRGVNACLTLSIEVAGPYRYLRILVNPRHGSGCDLQSAIGHELQHAVEVLQNPKIVNYHTAFHFYLQAGPTGKDRFETPAAQQAGLDVFAEVRARKTCRAARM